MEKEERRRHTEEARIIEEPATHAQTETTVAELTEVLEKLKIYETHHTNVADAISSALDDTDRIDPRNMGFDDEPRTWKEAQASSEAKEWTKGYLDELKSLKEMGVYKLVPRSSVPAGAKIRKGCPVFTRKRDENGNVVHHKVRLVFKGFEQIYGKDYTMTTSPTARMESWRILLHLAAALDWNSKQTDVKTAFLYSLLPDDEVQWMEQPEGMEEEGFEDYVWMLQRGLYGMKQAGRLWNKTMDAAMIEWGFTRLSSESCIYYRRTESGIVIAVVHVDDFLSIADSEEENKRFEAQMATRWIISSLGEPKFCIGIAIKRNRADRTVTLSQTALIDKIIIQFGQREAHPISTPMDAGLKLRRPPPGSITPTEREKLSKLPYQSLVGCLIYLAVGTRFDISYAVQQLSQFFDCYTYAHWNAAIRVVRYLKGTRELKLTLGGETDLRLVGYTDSDWANCLDTRRSVGGFGFTLGAGLISWNTKKQKTVASSSCEAEYTAAFEASKEAIWLRTLLMELKFIHPSTPTTILCDNNAAICLSSDPSMHSRVKHIDIQYHFLRERVQNKELALSYINTKDNIADIFTKALTPGPFTRLRSFGGLR